RVTRHMGCPKVAEPTRSSITESEAKAWRMLVAALFWLEELSVWPYCTYASQRQSLPNWPLMPTVAPMVSDSFEETRRNCGDHTFLTAVNPLQGLSPNR